MKKQQYCDQTSLPIDLALELVSSLEASDVCSLGSCSRFWEQICGSDCLWKSLCKQRWPALAILQEESLASTGKSDFDQQKDCHMKKRWKIIYSKQHTELAGNVASLQKCLVAECVDIVDYLKVIEDMKIQQFGLNDVRIFFFKSKANVLLNLAGLHYCMNHLNVQAEDVLEAITASDIQERQVCIQWRKKGGWMHRFPLPDELHRHCLSLGELVTTKGDKALQVLDHGLTHEIVQVHLSSTIPECSAVGGCEFTYVIPYRKRTPQTFMCTCMEA